MDFRFNFEKLLGENDVLVNEENSCQIKNSDGLVGGEGEWQNFWDLKFDNLKFLTITGQKIYSSLNAELENFLANFKWQIAPKMYKKISEETHLAIKFWVLISILF